MTQRACKPPASWTWSHKASALNVLVAMKSDGVCFVSLCRGIGREDGRTEDDSPFLPAFLQISSGRYPEGGRCKKSLWISETRTQPPNQQHKAYTENARIHIHLLIVCTSVSGTKTNHVRQHLEMN